MSEIPRINVEQIRPIQTYIINAPRVPIVNVPVQLNMGFPIVNIPGCIEARRSNENENLVNTDPDGNLILCDAQYPSYDAMNYVPEELVFTEDSKPQRFKEPETPATDTPPPKKVEDCPPPDAPEIGTKIEDGKKEVTGYQLIGNRCVTQYKKLTMQQRIFDAVPSPPQVVSTTGITLIVTSAALSTPILLKAVKPLVKQIINRVKKLLGKKVEKPSLSMVRANSYREKKGLPPLKNKLK